MKNKEFNVRMLGECAVEMGNTCVNDSTKRTSKVWLLLVYLICNRARMISQEELAMQLWDGEPEDHHSGVLKTALWRVRQLLQPVSAVCDQELIIRKGGSYGWNPELLLTVDAEQMEEFYKAAGDVNVTQEEKTELLRQAVQLYKGEFLGKFSAESWVQPLSAYYRNLYLDAVLQLVELLPKDACAEEIESLCRNALSISPYHESFYQYLMRTLVAQGELKKAVGVYEEMREILFSNLGILPSEESQELFAEIQSQASIPALTADMLREQLREKDPPSGALFCDYATFKMFYQAEARSASRRGDAVHVGVLSVVGANQQELSTCVLERIMEQLRAGVLSGLRRGDVVSRCSSSQYVVLLLQANYENSKMVCERLVRSFVQTYPRSAARIRYTVLPLEPMKNSFDTPATDKVGWHASMKK